MKFPNKMIQETHKKALGKVFTYSPFNKKFTDDKQDSSYNFHAMLWLKDQGWLKLLPFSGEGLVNLYWMCNTRESGVLTKHKRVD